MLSPHLTVEEAYLLAKYVRSIDPQAMLALGPVPVVGEDETFKNGFTIRAEKCPNRRGVEEVVAALHAAAWPRSTTCWPAIDAGEIGGVWVSGGYQARLDRRGDGRAVRRLGTAGRAGSVRLAAVGAGHLSVARRRVCRARRLVRQPRRPVAERRLGRCVRRPACGSKGRCTGSCSASRACTSARACSTNWPREIRYFAAAADRCRRSGVDLKVNQLADGRRRRRASQPMSNRRQTRADELGTDCMAAV